MVKKISRSQQTVVLHIWQKIDKEKVDMYGFPVHDCTQKQNSSSYFSSVSFENANDGHGNVTSHFFLSIQVMRYYPFKSFVIHLLA